MSKKYGIRYFDPNPHCQDQDGAKKTFWVPVSDEEEKPVEFEDRESAQKECDRLQGLPGDRPCRHCRLTFPHSALKYFVEEISDRTISVGWVNL